MSHCSSLKLIFLCFFAVKPTVIHTDMFVNSIGPVNAINMVSNNRKFSQYVLIVVTKPQTQCVAERGSEGPHFCPVCLRPSGGDYMMTQRIAHFFAAGRDSMSCSSTLQQDRHLLSQRIVSST